MTSGRVPIFARYRDPTRYASTTYERANEQTIEYTWLHGVVSSGDIQITSSMMFTDTYTQYAERGMTYYDLPTVFALLPKPCYFLISW